MTKKDYKLVALAIQYTRGDKAQQLLSADETINTLLMYLCRKFKEGNSKFDKERFLKACQPESKS